MKNFSTMKPIFYIISVLILLSSFIVAKDYIEDDNQKRNGKLLNLFNIVKFKNGPCSGATKNGTCYTASECLQRGGINDGVTCAGGFGVCCVFNLGCGSSSSQNCTYFSMSATTSPTTNPCTMTICKCSSNICRIRLDFISHVIANPISTATVDAGTCVTDAFSVTSPGSKSPPVICGYNTGQHMFLDASDLCHEMNFNFGTTDTTTSRMFDIKVTQYECGSEKGGPKGCLQYFTGTSGTIASFNYRTDLTTVPTDATHLINQDYSNCFRQLAGNCRICFAPAIANSFGLDSTSTTTSNVDSDCTTDYIMIPGATTTTGTSTTAPGSFKICGRFFSSVGGATTATQATACTVTSPFKLSFKSDGTEPTAKNNGSPSGRTGYFLKYEQSSTNC